MHACIASGRVMYLAVIHAAPRNRPPSKGGRGKAQH